MKLKGWLALVAMNLALLSTNTQANIILHGAPTLKGEDFCSKAPGRWTGNGVVEKGILKCEYNGTVDVTGAGGDYNFAIVLNKTKGACPAGETLNMKGSCRNNAVDIYSDNAHLSGSVNTLPDGRLTTNMDGKVTVPVVGEMKVKMTVSHQ